MKKKKKVFVVNGVELIFSIIIFVNYQGFGGQILLRTESLLRKRKKKIGLNDNFFRGK